MPTPSREEKRCLYCDGDGKIRDYEYDEYDRGIGISQYDCFKCKGTGIISKK